MKRWRQGGKKGSIFPRCIEVSLFGLDWSNPTPCQKWSNKCVYVLVSSNRTRSIAEWRRRLKGGSPFSIGEKSRSSAFGFSKSKVRAEPNSCSRTTFLPSDSRRREIRESACMAYRPQSPTLPKRSRPRRKEKGRWKFSGKKVEKC